MDTYPQIHTRVKLLGGDADVDHTQTIGGIQPNYRGDISPRPPRVSAPLPSSKEDIDELANKVHSIITKSYEAACPMRKLLPKKDNIWWNSELASLRKEARRAWRKAIKTKQEEDLEAQKLNLAYFKKAVRRAKRDSWHSFLKSVNNPTPTAWACERGVQGVHRIRARA